MEYWDFNSSKTLGGAVNVITYLRRFADSDHPLLSVVVFIPGKDFNELKRLGSMMITKPNAVLSVTKSINSFGATPDVILICFLVVQSLTGRMQIDWY